MLRFRHVDRLRNRSDAFAQRRMDQEGALEISRDDARDRVIDEGPVELQAPAMLVAKADRVQPPLNLVHDQWHGATRSRGRSPGPRQPILREAH